MIWVRSSTLIPDRGPLELGLPQSGTGPSASLSWRIRGMAFTALPASLLSHSSRLRIMQPQVSQSKASSSSSRAVERAVISAISFLSFLMDSIAYFSEGLDSPRAFTRRCC